MREMKITSDIFQLSENEINSDFTLTFKKNHLHSLTFNKPQKIPLKNILKYTIFNDFS